MIYFKINTGKFIQYDEITERAVIILKSDLLQQKLELEARTATADPNQPKTNEQWLAWAKDHYPYVDHSVEVTELERIKEIIEAIKVL